MDRQNIQLIKEIIFFSIIISGIFIIAFSVTFSETPQTKRFEVVDEYEGCEVVQYYNQGRATYSYFLDCREGAAPRP